MTFVLFVNEIPQHKENTAKMDLGKWYTLRKYFFHLGKNLLGLHNSMKVIFLEMKPKICTITMGLIFGGFLSY